MHITSTKEKIYDDNKCPLCKKSGTYIFTTKDRYFNKPGIFYLFHCNNCHIDFIECPNNLSDFYGNDYFDDFSLKESYLFKIKAHIIFNYYSSRNSIKKMIYRFFLGFIAALPEKKGRIVDVGCGPGDILFLLKNVGFDVYGLDISEYAVDLAHKNGLRNVVVGMEDKLNTFQDGYFDCIRGSHVIEHMQDPIGFVRNCYKKLAKGGSLILSTPNINSFNRSIFGKYTKCYSDIPRHVVIFSNKALGDVLRDTGFRSIKVTYKTLFSDFYEGLYYFVDSNLNISDTNTGKKLRRNIFINFILLPFDFIAIILKKGETMTITAVK